MITIYLKKINGKTLCSADFIKEVLKIHYDNIKSDDLSIGFNNYGKPYLVNYLDFNYNISHTKKAIICGCALKPIGIDIEYIKKFNMKIANRFFTEDEQEYVFFNKDLRNIRFAEIWTKKEAYLKCLGVGMAVSFESFNVLKNKQFVSLFIDNYCISICSSEIDNIHSLTNNIKVCKIGRVL